MLTLAFSILLISLPFANCQQGICFSYGVNGSCEIGGYSVHESEISNLQGKCTGSANDDGAFDKNLNWLVLRGTLITGLAPVSNICGNFDPGLNLAWISWNKKSELFKGSEFLENTQIFAKSRGSKKDVYCSFNTQAGYCKDLFSENGGSLHNANFYLLVELKPVHYELRILACEDRNGSQASDVVLAKKTFSNLESESQIINETVTYTAITRLKFKLNDIRIPIRKDLPIRIFPNNSLPQESNDGYYLSETKHFPIYFKLEADKTVKLDVKTEEISRRCDVKANLVIFYDDAASETRTISFEATKTNYLEPVQHVNYIHDASYTTSTKQGPHFSSLKQEVNPNSARDGVNLTSTWMIVLYVIGGLLILILLICCWLKFCINMNCYALCGVCQACFLCYEAFLNIY